MTAFSLNHGNFHKNKATINLITIALLINILKYVKINQFIVRRLCDALLFILHLRIFRILRCYIWGIRVWILLVGIYVYKSSYQ